LRRKTPNGTIDAGYDGTPAQLSSGPPPLKHMILPASGNLPLASATQLNHEYNTAAAAAAGDGWSFRSALTGNLSEPRGFDSSLLNLWPHSGSWQYGADRVSRPAMALDCAPNAPSTAYYPYNNGMRVPTVLQPTYQQSPGPTVFNNGGLLPLPPWPDVNFHGTQANAFAAPSIYMTNRQSMLPSRPSESALNLPLGGAGPRYDFVRGNVQVPAQRLESLTLESGRYDTAGTQIPEVSSPARFREKALANAHRTYVDLLAYIHSTKKTHSGRSSNGSRSSSKMVIFPKLPNPPKQPASGFGRHQPRSLYAYTKSMDDGYRTSGHSGPTSSYMSQGQGGVPDLAQMSHNVNHNFSVGREVTNAAYYHLFNNEGSRYGTPDMSRPPIAPSAVSSALAAVEMLHHLCEQSGWKWVDGMLLGGCLYYGLEKYEHALEWFSRIVAMDDR
jgi:hypothetical protein